MEETDTTLDPSSKASELHSDIYTEMLRNDTLILDRTIIRYFT